jgi:hypothetical protein
MHNVFILALFTASQLQRIGTVLRRCPLLFRSERTPRDIREREAEPVSLLCCESLGPPGAEYSRGYIQSWGQGQTFTAQSAQRIFRAAGH